MSFATIRASITASIAAVALLTPLATSSAALSAYSQNFESLVQTDPAALANDGWLVFGNVFNPGGGYLYGYGVFPAPNAGNAFSNIAAGEGGVTQGAQQLVIFSDYNNGDHANGNLIEANVFQERSIAAGDVGSQWRFEFDAKLGNLVAPTTAVAFIKTLDPSNGFATTNFLTFNTASLPNTWGRYSIDITITPGLAGQLLQFGFNSTATNYNASGVFYDNINFSLIPAPGAASLAGLAGLLAARRRR